MYNDCMDVTAWSSDRLKGQLNWRQLESALNVNITTDVRTEVPFNCGAFTYYCTYCAFERNTTAYSR